MALEWPMEYLGTLQWNLEWLFSHHVPCGVWRVFWENYLHSLNVMKWEWSDFFFVCIEYLWARYWDTERRFKQRREFVCQKTDYCASQWQNPTQLSPEKTIHDDHLKIKSDHLLILSICSPRHPASHQSFQALETKITEMTFLVQLLTLGVVVTLVSLAGYFMGFALKNAHRVSSTSVSISSAFPGPPRSTRSKFSRGMRISASGWARRRASWASWALGITRTSTGPGRRPWGWRSWRSSSSASPLRLKISGFMDVMGISEGFLMWNFRDFSDLDGNWWELKRDVFSGTFKNGENWGWDHGPVAMWPCVQAVAAVMVLWFKLSCWCFGPKKKTWKDCL